MDELTFLDLPNRIDSSRHPEWEKLSKYCYELSALDMDLQFIRTKLLGEYYALHSQRAQPESAHGLIIKKFLVTHVEEDYCHRSYAYREKAYQLANAALGLGVREDALDPRKQVRDGLATRDGRQVLQRFGKFEGRKAIKDMFERRKALAHRLS